MIFEVKCTLNQFIKRKMFRNGSNAACVLGQKQREAGFGTGSRLYKAFSDVLNLRQSARDV